MQSLYRVIFYMVFGMAGIFHFALADNKLPELGKMSTESVGEREAKRISDAVYIQLRREGALLDDAEISSYLNGLGNKLVRVSQAGRHNFRFYPILDAEINAFAVPGGLIAVNTGLFLAAQHESEIAAVLAHEIAHVTEEHAARMIFSQRNAPWIMAASVAISILAAKSGRGDAAIAALAGSQGLILQNQLTFTQHLEEEADRVGMETLKNSGFDPAAMPDFFEKLLQKERYHVHPAPAFLRTHPLTAKRVRDSQTRLTDYPYRQVPDSIHFLLTREKVRVLQANNLVELLHQYHQALLEKRYQNLAAQYYGMAFTEYQSHLFADALNHLRKARVDLKKNNPMLDNLEGLILVKLGRVEEALNLFHNARRMYPSNPSIMYSELETLIQAKKIKEAIRTVKTLLESYQTDPKLYQYAAKAYALAGELQKQYYMQSEYYAYSLEYSSAITLLEQALAEKKEDFYTMTMMEARLKQLQRLAELYK